MNLAHAHLLLNHLPPLGALFGFLLLAAATLRKSGELTRAAFATLALAGFLAIPAYYTGEPAEKVVENLPEVTEAVIGPHEDSAEASLIAALALGVLSCAGLMIYRGRALPRGLTLATLALALVVTAMMAWTAHLGGQIRHAEIRGGAPLAAPADKD